MQREIPPESLSRVSSYDALGSLMFGPIGLLLAGPVALAYGPKPALLGCAAIIVIVTLSRCSPPTCATCAHRPRCPLRQPSWH